MRRSASVLAAYSECAHLAWLDRRAALGLEPRPAAPDAAAELLFAHGREHERRRLEQYRADGIEVVTIEDSYRQPEAAAAATLAAMRGGAPVLYQGVLIDEGWWGIPDFLERVERPSALGAWSYEVVDAKLARRSKTTFLLQLGLYSALLAAAQGAEPERLHVELGTGERENFRVADFAAYFRRLRARALVATSADHEPCYPGPVEFCGVCAWSARCESRREHDDHLSRVANIRGTQIRRLSAAGIDTLAALAALPEETRVPRMAPATLGVLRRQARLQRAQATTGTPSFEFLPPEPGRGFALLPAPSPGDVFFDMEGDPYVEGGLEYLFGATAADDDGVPRYHAWWGHDRGDERRAFEDFIDFVVARRALDPAMRVYHYAPYEPTALKRLAGFHGTREAELDDLLRGGVLVDLYRVVRQGLCISQPSYSIKRLEVFYAGKREGGVTDAGQSIVAYERWMDDHDQSILDAIERYNEDDCDSTLKLRDWLLARRAEAPVVEARATTGGRSADVDAEPAVESPRAVSTRLRNEEKQRGGEEAVAIAARLLEGLDPDPAALGHVERAQRLLAFLLEYHAREARPGWWAYFARRDMTDEELVEDPESIGGMTADPDHPPRPEKQSTVFTFRFPSQESKLSTGECIDPATGRSAGTVLAVETAERRLRLKRGKSLAAVPLPRAIGPTTPIDDEEKREAVRRFARDVEARGIAAAGRYRALRELLLRTAPRVAGVAPGAPLVAGEVTEVPAAAVVAGLDESTLFVQGPPGSGKTWLGARLIVGLLAAGKRVGVAAHSHRAIHNLLAAVEAVAEERGVSFVGVKKSSGGNEESLFKSALATPRITSRDVEKGDSLDGCGLIAGTGWFFSRPELDSTLDVLFVDEAGQVALADAIAVGTAARNLVFLGDPHQLAQVAQGTHPDGAGVSVLQHLLGDDATVPPDRGLFLGTSWRMHPEVCGFISESFYDSRLHAAPHRERQRIDAPGVLAGAGVRFVPVEHAGNAQRAPEEAERIATLVAELLQGSWTDVDGATHPMTPADIKVVTPYNAQAQELRERLPAGVAVGTVDKFQGQEAPVVFFSMATSSGEDLPRNLEFLFSRNRLNVAISRARALAVLVASPRLLDVACRTVEQMRLVNALCRFVERAPAAQ